MFRGIVDFTLLLGGYGTRGRGEYRHLDLCEVSERSDCLAQSRAGHGPHQYHDVVVRVFRGEVRRTCDVWRRLGRLRIRTGCRMQGQPNGEPDGCAFRREAQYEESDGFGGAGMPDLRGPASGAGEIRP